MHWNAIIFGPDGAPPAACPAPAGTVWDGGVFKLSMEFSEDYPNKAPVVKFRTPMFHPNSEGAGGSLRRPADRPPAQPARQAGAGKPGRE